MDPCKNILVPTDFGEAARRALDFALMLAPRFEAGLTLLHSVPFPPSAYAVYGEAHYWPIEQVTERAQSALDAALSEARARYSRTEGLIVNDDPREAILEVAKARGADLIVMGTHGRRGLSRFFLGSIAEWIVRTSPIPVVTISGRPRHEPREERVDEPVDEPRPAL